MLIAQATSRFAASASSSCHSQSTASYCSPLLIGNQRTMSAKRQYSETLLLVEVDRGNWRKFMDGAFWVSVIWESVVYYFYSHEKQSEWIRVYFKNFFFFRKQIFSSVSLSDRKYFSFWFSGHQSLTWKRLKVYFLLPVNNQINRQEMEGNRETYHGT